MRCCPPTPVTQWPSTCGAVLDRSKRYRAALQPPAAGYHGLGELPAWARDGVVLSVGLQLLSLHPEHLAFIRLSAEK